MYTILGNQQFLQQMGYLGISIWVYGVVFVLRHSVNCISRSRHSTGRCRLAAHTVNDMTALTSYWHIFCHPKTKQTHYCMCIAFSDLWVSDAIELTHGGETKCTTSADTDWQREVVTTALVVVSTLAWNTTKDENWKDSETRKHHSSGCFGSGVRSHILITGTFYV